MSSRRGTQAAALQALTAQIEILARLQAECLAELRFMRQQDAKPLRSAVASLEQPETLSLKQAAGRTSMTTETMRRWVKRLGMGRKVGGRWAIERRKIDAFIEARSP